MKRSFKPGIAILPIALVVTWYLGGGTSGAVTSDDPAPAELPEVTSAATAEDLYETWAGTPNQRQAAEVVVAYALNGGYSACMAERGFSRHWQDTIMPAPIHEPLAASLWAAGDLDGLFSAEQEAAARVTTFETFANDTEATGGEQQAELECREANPGAGDDEVHRLRMPDEYQKLKESWTSSLETAQTQVGSIDAYVACIDSAETATPDGGTAQQDWVEYLTEALPAEDVSLEGEPRPAEWREFQAAEDTYADLDWSCRSQNRSETVQELVPRLDDLSSHESETIQRLAEHWAQMEDQALGLGWSPDDPFAGSTLVTVAR